MAPRYKLKLSKLDFISIVDEPAQPNAKCLLIKRAGKNERISATARLVKTSDELGLAFFWAFTSTNPDGSDHHDLQGDAIAADDAMVKACADFMERGGPADQQHDSSTIGKTVFAMPMTPEIAKAFGVVTKTSGLMIAIRPSKEVLAKLKDGSYSGVSIAGLGERTPVEKRRVRKDVVLTSLVDGHQHSLELDDPATGWSDQLCTSLQTAEGATTSHSHAWVYDAATGLVTIAADSGHTHTVSMPVPADALAAATAIEAAEDKDIAAIPAEIAAEPSDGVPCAVEAEESSGATVNVTIVQARAPQSPTTIAPAAPVGASKSTLAGGSNEPVSMNDADRIKQLEADHANVTKRAERLDRIAKMSGAHKTHFDTLTGDDAEAFLAKSTSDREAVVSTFAAARAAEIEKSNAVEYTSPVDGTVYRKSDDPRLVAMAKREAAEVAKREAVEVEKRVAEEIPLLKGTLAAKGALLKSVSGIADEKLRGEVLETLKGANAAMKSLGEPVGSGDGNGAVSPLATFNAELATFAKAANKTPVQATSDFIRTERGAELYAAATSNN